MRRVEPVVVVVRLRADVLDARRRIEALGSALQLDGRAIGELAIVVSELGSNLIDHAGGGEISGRLVKDGAVELLEIVAEDEGPGIADVGAALADGYSTRGGLGGGLGAVNRLMDVFAIEHSSSKGTRIRCAKRVPRAPRSLPCPLEVGVAARPCAGEQVSGDAFVNLVHDGALLVGVIDGVGHGRPAHAAAIAARTFVERHAAESFARIFSGADAALTATRGAVIALARFEWTRQLVAIASVGNIECWSPDINVKPSIKRGILGKRGRVPYVQQHALREGSRWVFYSDGIRDIARQADRGWPNCAQHDAAGAARHFLNLYERGDDDATVLAVVWPPAP